MRRGGSRGDRGAPGSPSGRQDLRSGPGSPAEPAEVHPARAGRLRRPTLRYLTASVLVVVVCLLLLVEAGASGARSRPAPGPSPSAGCSPQFRVAFVGDVAGLRSAQEAAAYRAVTRAAAQLPCAHPELISSLTPSSYDEDLELAVRHENALVIGGSFLLADALVNAAGRHPGTKFILVDPLVPATVTKNLLVVTFRRDQAAFVAGALGALTTRSGVIAGIYGPDGVIDRQQRQAFEQGAHTVRPGVRVLGAFQPAGTSPYSDPAWGARQARDFADRGADVLFAAGGATGLGALTEATAGGQACIGIDVPKPGFPGAPGCLVARITTSIESGLGRAVLATATSPWTPGTMALGFADGGLGLDLARRADPLVVRRIQELLEQLTDGRLATGV